MSRLPLVIATISLLAPWTASSREIRTERVRFEPGASSGVVEGSITGYELIDYVLTARKGQSMNVSMATNNTASYFNLLPPGEDEVAMFNGSVGENQYEGVLPESGDYRVRVYLMRSAARRNEVAHFRLEMTVDADPGSADTTVGESAAVDAATRAGQGDFDATGQIPCAQYRGQPMGQCVFGVSRESGGSAAVVITWPDGRTRAIFFVDGRPSSADTSQADGYGELRVEREADLNLIRIGNERYEIPDAVIFGG